MKTHRDMIRKLMRALMEAGNSVPDPAASQRYQEIANEAAQWLIDTQPKSKPQWDWRKENPDVILAEEQA